MTTIKGNTLSSSTKALVSSDADLMKALMKQALQEVLEAEMTEFLGAFPGERSEAGSGYRAGYYQRGLMTRIGKLGFRPHWTSPWDSSGAFPLARPASSPWAFPWPLS